MNLSLLFEKLSEGILILDNGNNILYANPAAGYIFGKNAADLIGTAYKPSDIPNQLNIEPLRHSDFPLTAAANRIESIEWDGQKACLILFEKADETARRSILEALQSSQQRFRSCFDLPLIGFAITSCNHEYLEVNDKFCWIVGYTRQELSTMTWKDLTPPEDIPCELEEIEPIILGQKDTAQYEKRYLRKDATFIHVLISFACVRNPDFSINYFITLIEDISDRKKNEEKLRRQNQYLEAFHETTLGLINRMNVDELLEAIVRRACQLMGTDDGYLYIYDPDQNVMVVKVALGLFKDFTGFQMKKGEGLAGKVWQTKEMIILEDYDKWEGRSAAFPKIGYHAAMAVPLMVGSEEVMGVIGQSHQKVGLIFSEFEIDLMKRFAQLASIVMSNTINYEEARQQLNFRQQREYELETIASVSSALRSASSRAEIAHLILEQIMLLLNSTGTAMALIEPGSDEMVVESALGIWENLIGTRLPNPLSISRGVLETKIPFNREDIFRDQSFSKDSFNEIDKGAVTCVPMSVRDNPLGQIWITRKKPINDTDLRLLTAVTDIAANAIHRTSLHEKTEQQLQHMVSLHKIDLAIINTSHELLSTSQVILEQLVEQLGVDAADLFLYDPVSQMLEFICGHGFRSNVRSRLIGMEEGFAGQAVIKKQDIHISDITLEQYRSGNALYPEEEGFISYHAAPLIVAGEVKGVLEVFSRNLSPYAALRLSLEEWSSFFGMLVGQAAIAVDIARLFTELQQSNRELSQAYDATIEGWARALELRDMETEGHSRRVAEMTLALARFLGVGEEDLPHIRRGAFLHDVGKMATPDDILKKPGPLNPKEWEEMRKHPRNAYEMLEAIDFLRPALDIPWCHHEKWDGSGYPQMIKGNEIPLAARIFAIVDVWDALTHHRPYRPAWSNQKALEFIQSQSGKHFDPSVVEVFMKMVVEGDNPL